MCSAVFEAAVKTILKEERNIPMSEKSELELMKEQLFYNQKNGYDRIPKEEISDLENYCSRYIGFMNLAKTERECVTESVKLAEAAGFVPFVPGMELKPGTKIYRNNRGKALTLAVIGKKSAAEGVNIVASHIDSPRIDLKPNPLYEDSEMAFFKTHYYGGIKKYQWPTVPLELRGVVALKDGSVLDVCFGADKNEPVLVITDLLIHLAGDQMKKSLAEGIAGEALNVLLGSKPLEGEGSDRVKLAVMSILNKKYGIVEEDFMSAELSLVPAFEARAVGLDGSFIGAYGHDDRVCAYAALEGLLAIGVPEKTAVVTLADKEEIGSMGVSGMESKEFDTFIEDICDAQGVNAGHCFRNSACLSCDVSNAYDPNYPEVSDRRNNAKVNYGINICKYTGSRGKSGSSDASAEFMAKVRKLLDDGNVVWQTGELGKVDQGGGGTVAMIMANKNIDTVDVGVPVLSMHAPWEVVAKLDAYMNFKAAKVFFE